MALNTKIRGLQINDAFFGAALARNGVDGNIMDVKVDDSSIEVSSDALQVKALGITNDMLAGSITYAKLSLSDGDIPETKLAIAQGNLIVGDANGFGAELDLASAQIVIGDASGFAVAVDVTGDITISNAGITTIGDNKVDVGMLNINNAEVDGYVLTWNDSGYMEWTSKTVITEDFLQESEIKVENESANCNGVTTDFTLDSSPVANSVQVFLNGLLQEEGSGKDYTLSGTTVSFATAPLTNDILIIHYIAT